MLTCVLFKCTVSTKQEQLTTFKLSYILGKRGAMQQDTTTRYRTPVRRSLAAARSSSLVMPVADKVASGEHTWARDA